MALIEICDSAYKHYLLESIGQKKYYKHRQKNKIICEECLNLYLDEASKTLGREVFNVITKVDTKSLIHTSDIDRSNSFSFKYEKSLINDFMKYILPLKFDLNISFVYDKLTKYMDIDHLTALSTSDVAVNSAPITVNRIAVYYISSIVCDESYPSFKLSMDIRENDTLDIISENIRKYLSSFVESFFIELPEIAVQNIMNHKSTSIYSAACEAKTISGPKCAKCNVDIYSERYIYNDTDYCLNCMYEKVVQLSIDNNISDIVGLSVVNNNTSNYAIVDSTEWKRSVIDKYINAMSSFGIKVNISHYMMTCY